MKVFFSRTSVGLAVGITVAVAGAFAASAYLYSQRYFETLLDSARETAKVKGDLMREALEHQMLEKDRTLIADMVRSFGLQAGLEKVSILDHQGAVRYSSLDEEVGRVLSSSVPACQTCHDRPPAERGNTTVMESADGTLLRAVVPIRNQEACHQCHDPRQAVNGILILDSDLTALRTAMDRDLRAMVTGGGIITLLLLGAVAGMVQLLVLRRLRRFETTARLIARGDLERRVPSSGSDTISWLAKEFNTMADSMTRLLGEVRHQRERLETVINSIDDGIVVLDARRNILAANSAFLGRTGHVREEVVGCSCGDVAPGACNTKDCPTLACLDSGRRQVRICQRRDDDGRVAWEEVHASPIPGPDGEVTQVVEVWRDISERRTAEARLAESHRLASLGMLASGFSHELNTPLATILTCVEGILREAKGEGNGSEPAGRIRENAAIARDQILRCRGITQHFLRLSRGQSSPGDMVDVNRVVSSVTRLVEPTALARRVEVTHVLPDTQPRVRVDEADLQHALVNLLLNAVEASEAGGRVEVRVLAGSPVHIQVEDHGCGIPPEELDRIFEPFTSLRQGGTGLGLFLSLDFVRRWGGEIKVESAPGKGSRFEILLPALEGSPAREVSP
jgi:PAS domain S-box-containing protein